MKPGDVVSLQDKSSLYNGLYGLIEAVSDHVQAFNGPGACVNFVGQGTVWVRPERLRPATKQQTDNTTRKLDELTEKRKRRGLY